MAAVSNEEIKQRSQKEVTSPETGITYRIRKLSQIEYSRAGISGFMPVASKPRPMNAEELKESFKQVDVYLNSLQYQLEHGVVQPKLFFGPESETPEDSVHSSCIAGDEVWLGGQILEFTGLNEKNRQDLEDYSKNGQRSSSTTPSESDTESVLANS